MSIKSLKKMIAILERDYPDDNRKRYSTQTNEFIYYSNCSYCFRRIGHKDNCEWVQRRKDIAQAKAELASIEKQLYK